ncbi:hypothetical protein M513_03712 [Trichuris suis]|uniref:Uncharacterized protein n=1 Tax=Trichuris suis TaxID=68888 RepID=A0A085MDS6_9BILA|nr:hypothetical protein M513_03712 [Trichuris suis]
MYDDAIKIVGSSEVNASHTTRKDGSSSASDATAATASRTFSVITDMWPRGELKACPSLKFAMELR